MRENSNLRLLDVIIFILIIGVIATFAIPAYNANMKRAKAYEAEITLEVIQKIIQNYYQEHGHYPIINDAIPLSSLTNIDLNDDELSGRYYLASDYFYVSDSNGQKFKVKAIGTKPEVRSLNREIDESGKIYRKLTF